MRVAVLGAGAVGCFYGGMLARAGHAVTLIGRPLHVEAFRVTGLNFEGLKFHETIPVGASTEAEAVRGARLVLFCVKSTDTETAAEQIAPHLGADTIVLNLQNGVDNTERIAARTHRAVIPAVVHVATEMLGPGHLKHHGRGDLAIGPIEDPAPASLVRDLKDVQRWFAAAGVPVEISDNVQGALWGKLAVNCAYNAVSAIGQAPYGKMIESIGIRDVMRDATAEVLAVAKACGVRMAPDTMDRVMGIAGAMAGQRSSTAQDLARGRRTEIDHLNGYIVRQAEKHGIPVPVNKTLYALVKLIEAMQREGSGQTPR
ncbi:MAG: ketopantoate reductase family protein [Proteobacteria bacterium]|nr:ketopantoate reductase family protein [Pseudomonadota bacterium]